jgi:hypothetical protein
MKMHAYLHALIAATLVAACTTAGVEKPPPAIEPEHVPAAPAAVTEPAPPVEVVPPPPVAAPEPPAALRALRFYTALKERPAREQRQEQERLRKSFAASRSDYDRIRLALAFSVPGSSPTEESQALELLEPLVRDLRNNYHELAVLVAALLAEQHRRGEQAASLQQKLERIKALEKEMQERSSARGSRPR